jgi:hypothetical protein
MTLQQLAKQLNISSKRLEKESLRVFLLSKLGEIEASRQKILKKYDVQSSLDWDEKLQAGKKEEGGYQGVKDYFHLETLDLEKNQVIKDLLSF